MFTFFSYSHLKSKFRDDGMNQLTDMECSLNVYSLQVLVPQVTITATEKYPKAKVDILLEIFKNENERNQQ